LLTRLTGWLQRAEKILYFSIGTALAATAVVLLVWSVMRFVQNALDGQVGEAVLQMLDSLLLVIMLIEILHTVEISLHGQMLKIEPFILVGVIAAVRRILIVTAEQANPSAEHITEFQMAMLELGILTAMILALVGATVLIRKFSSGKATLPDTPPEQQQQQQAALADS
jgi:uncharacterized membrane protein (DUF373 family)